MADKFDDKTLEVKLDYAVPQYRDFKIGKFLFEQNRKFFLDKGFKQFVAFTDQPMHVKYLLKMGFHEVDLGHRIGYMKTI